MNREIYEHGRVMNYVVFSGSTGIMFWAGKEADSLREAGKLGRVYPISDDLLRVAITRDVRVGVLEVDAIMGSLEPMLTIDVSDELRAAADMGALAFFYSAENRAGTGYQLAWQPSIRRVAIQREGSDVVDVAHGETLLHALVEHFSC